MYRRNFLQGMGASAVGSLALLQWVEEKSAQAATEEIVLQGSDLTEWEVALGDGLYCAAGQAPVSTDDIGVAHFGDYSQLSANRWQRGIMAHNITYKRQINPAALNFVHRCELEFRLPFVPTTSGGELNAQTVELSFFIWDGAGSQIDYGLALQWILNPWMSSFGDLRAWMPPGTNTAEGGWQSVGTLPVDTAWHRVQMVFDYQTQMTAVTIDGNHFLSTFSGTAKPATWGTETAARFSAEIISIYPGENASAPKHVAEVRNWRWQWLPATNQCMEGNS